MIATEIEVKLKRLAEFLDWHRLDALLLTERANFAWITAGRVNRIANNTPVGVASILVTRTSRICLANTIEAPRMLAEELTGTGIRVIDYPWHDTAAAAKIMREAIGSLRVAADVDLAGLGLAPLPPGFVELRWSLHEGEIARYREGARRTTTAMQLACREMKPGMSEHEIAGLLDHHVHRQGVNPVVTLIATDERIERFRHPIPTDKKLSRYAMLVTCAEYRGLISCMTRFVHFGKPADELRRKHQAVCNVDAAINLSTRPGKTLGELFGVLSQAYAANGFPDEYRLHHQGGPTGYANREALATPDSPLVVRENQAFAWNPSITGTKSEDTMLVTARGVEPLTQITGDWPRLIGIHNGQSLARADMLVL